MQREEEKKASLRYKTKKYLFRRLIKEPFHVKCAYGILVLGVILYYVLYLLGKQAIGQLEFAITATVAYPLIVFPTLPHVIRKGKNLTSYTPLYLLLITAIFSVIIVPIFFFGLFYETLFQADLSKPFLHWFYFSSITFAGLGLGDLPLPNSELAKVAVLIESLLGYFYFGMIIVYTTKLIGIVSSPNEPEEKERKEITKAEKDLPAQPPKRKLE